MKSVVEGTVGMEKKESGKRWWADSRPPRRCPKIETRNFTNGRGTFFQPAIGGNGVVTTAGVDGFARILSFHSLTHTRTRHSRTDGRN